MGSTWLGLYYRWSCGGVAQDHAETVRHFLLAADQGHALAQVNCGTMFEYGIGIAKDTAESIRWFRLAAAQGHAFATAALRKLRA